MPPEIKESTLLHIAVYGGNCAEIKSLLQFGSDVNAQNEDGDTPLHIAIRYGRYNAVPLLIKYGADLWIENHTGDIPLCEPIIKQEPRICLGMLVASGHISTGIFRKPEIIMNLYQYLMSDKDVDISQYLQPHQEGNLEEVDVENIASKKNKTILETPLYMKN